MVSANGPSVMSSRPSRTRTVVAVLDALQRRALDPRAVVPQARVVGEPLLPPGVGLRRAVRPRERRGPGRSAACTSRPASLGDPVASAARRGRRLDDGRRGGGSTAPPEAGALALAPGVAVAPGVGPSGSRPICPRAAPRAQPRVALRPAGAGRRRRVAHEALERGDDRRGLLGRGGGRRRSPAGGGGWARAREGYRRRRRCPSCPSSTTTRCSPPSRPRAIERTRDAFVRHHRGEWVMPSKVYLDSPPHGDFRAMPARGGDLAMLKWISSFPGNPAARAADRHRACVVPLRRARPSEPLALLDAGAVTALRTGAVAAVAAQALARPGRGPSGIVGCGLHGAWAARCLAAAGYGPGVCADPRADAAEALAAELGVGWRAGSRAEALACDVVCCVTPGRRARRRRRPTCTRACTSTCSAPTARARPRRRSRPSPRCGSSATSGSRRRTAAS